MNVLWFCLSPSLAQKQLAGTKHYGLGWIESLEKQMNTKVNLSVAFYYEKKEKSFTINNTTYYPISRFRHGKISLFFRRLNNQIESHKDIKQFLNIINLSKPDLIHIHGTEGPFGLIQCMTKIPVVISIQGIISVCLIKYFSGITINDVFKYTSFSNRFFLRSYNRKYQQIKLQAKREKETLKLSKHIIGRTDWDRRVTHILAPNAKYFHNDEILRGGFYKINWEHKTYSTLSLITVISPNLFKGLESVLYCATLLDTLNINYSWSVVGVNVNDNLVSISRKSLKLKNSPRIKFLGILGENELIRELLNSDIFVSTSHIENSSNSLCEALMLGLPCIATDAGGTSSLINNKREGIIIQDGDPYVLAGAIIELHENRDRAVEYGLMARKRAIERHNPEKISSELLSIYTKIVNSNFNSKGNLFER